MAAKPFTAAEREELADCRLLLGTAEHNLGAVLRGDEPVQAIANAIRSARQALATLERLEAARVLRS